jgi:hypothetical protein
MEILSHDVLAIRVKPNSVFSSNCLQEQSHYSDWKNEAGNFMIKKKDLPFGTMPKNLTCQLPIHSATIAYLVKIFLLFLGLLLSICFPFLQPSMRVH